MEKRSSPELRRVRASENKQTYASEEAKDVAKAILAEREGQPVPTAV
jgi:hypothetical protein